MNPIHIPGNEPDADDMSTEPGIVLPDDATDHSSPNDEDENAGG
jgi:hypothetical protein